MAKFGPIGKRAADLNNRLRLKIMLGMQFVIAVLWSS